MKISPYFIGSGRTSNAIQKTLAVLALEYPQWKINECVQLKRGELEKLDLRSIENPILFITTPHALHADAILLGERLGFKGIVTEKPSCVDIEQLEKLKKVKTPTAVCHVYRQMWGVQTLKKKMDAGDFGDLVCIEGRYWQSSTAVSALTGGPKKSWKNEPKLSGEFDALIDIGVHWVDAVSYLFNENKFTGSVWLSNANSEATHRDSHAQLQLDFKAGQRAMGSVSKNIHGATNHFEVNLIGTKASATWNFLNPDEIILGHGKVKQTLVRQDEKIGSGLPGFHGMGWLEGYIEILHQFFSSLNDGRSKDYPSLSENLEMMESLLGLMRFRS